MKHLFALAFALLFAFAPNAMAESAFESSDTGTTATGSRGIQGLPGVSSGSDRDTRRSEILSVARSVKPGNLPLSMIDAIIARESGYRADARGARGEVGLMQILPATARNVARDHGIPSVANMSNAELVRYLSEPRNNLRLGLAYLYWCYNRAGEDVGATIGCYNAGPANMWRWESISVTRSYVRHVKQHMARSGFAGS